MATFLLWDIHCKEQIYTGHPLAGTCPPTGKRQLQGCKVAFRILLQKEPSKQISLKLFRKSVSHRAHTGHLEKAGSQDSGRGRAPSPLDGLGKGRKG